MSKILINLRVTTQTAQGGRKYMEDVCNVRFKETDEGDVQFGFFGVFDGHGGPDAAKFASRHLLDHVTGLETFWSDNEDDVKSAIRSGFLETHNAMWKDIGTWPRTMSGLPSTAGTTASVAIIKHKKLYVAHVGDSAIVLGTRNPDGTVTATQLTKDHKPEDTVEKQRIEAAGGSVMKKAGVERVVWNRPRLLHKGPVRRSTEIEKIPFLAVARSLGDLWSYNYQHEAYAVSPDPDIVVVELDTDKHFCVLLASDGLWNMVTADEAIKIVHKAEKDTEDTIMKSITIPPTYWINPSVLLVKEALKRWSSHNMRADNTSCITVMLDPPGPPRASVYKRKRKLLMKQRNIKPLDTSSSSTGDEAAVPGPSTEPADSGSSEPEVKRARRSTPEVAKEDDGGKGVAKPQRARLLLHPKHSLRAKASENGASAGGEDRGGEGERLRRRSGEPVASPLSASVLEPGTSASGATPCAPPPAPPAPVDEKKKEETLHALRSGKILHPCSPQHRSDSALHPAPSNGRSASRGRSSSPGPGGTLTVDIPESVETESYWSPDAAADPNSSTTSESFLQPDAGGETDAASPRGGQRAFLEEVEKLQCRFGGSLPPGPAKTLKHLKAQLQNTLHTAAPPRRKRKAGAPDPSEPSTKVPLTPAGSDPEGGDVTPIIAPDDDPDTTTGFGDTTLRSRLNSFFQSRKNSKMMKRASAIVRRITRSRSAPLRPTLANRDARKRALSDKNSSGDSSVSKMRLIRTKTRGRKK